jgi:hypothetical protein
LGEEESMRQIMISLRGTTAILGATFTATSIKNREALPLRANRTSMTLVEVFVLPALLSVIEGSLKGECS